MHTNIQKILDQLKQEMVQYDKVLLFESADSLYEFYSSENLNVFSWRVLMLSLAPEPPTLDGVMYRQITKEELELLSCLYFTYEFSDKFILIPKKTANYPSLYNFVSTGCLNRREVIRLLVR